MATKSENRQRQHVVAVRLTADEFAALRARATYEEQSSSEILRFAIGLHSVARVAAPVAPALGQCMAITHAGRQCRRAARHMILGFLGQVLAVCGTHKGGGGQ